MDTLLFYIVKIPTIAVIVSADLLYGVLFGFQPIVVLGLQLTDTHSYSIGVHRPCAHRPPSVVYEGLCFRSYTSEFLLPLK